MEFVHFFKGILIGFSIAAPVGPVALMCIRRTLKDGLPFGLAAGSGAATADLLYAFVAGYGLTFLADFIIEHILVLRLISGIFLIYLGTLIYRENVHQAPRSNYKRGLIAAYSSTFLLTLANPLTIIAFMAVFAGFGEPTVYFFTKYLLIGGVALGSALWWTLLTIATNTFRTRITLQKLGFINKLAGVIISIVGSIALISIFIA